jgi:predicted nicotinamide N-methyase
MVLLLPGPEHKEHEEDGTWLVAGHRITVDEHPNNDDQGPAETGERQTTYKTIWDGAIVLIKYLEFSYRPETPPVSVLELGAGCGLTGIACGVLFPDASITLTDLPSALESLHANVAANESIIGTNRVRVRALDWTNRDEERLGPVDLILAADVVWLTDLIQPFIDTLHEITADNPGCVTLMAYQSRSKKVDELLFSGLKQRSFLCQPLETSRKITIYRIAR